MTSNAGFIPLETDRLTLASSSLMVERAILQGPDAVARVTGLRVASGWPGPDWLEVLPSLIEMYEAQPDGCAWNRNIVHREDRTLIGGVGCVCPPQEEGAVSLGYYIVPGSRRQGFAREAVGAYVAWLLAQPAVQVIRAECLVSNVPSCRILERVGMRTAGFFEDEEGPKVRWELRGKEPLNS
ncbi:MAG TPA: GNAT family N-acetyltransferase [Candidatus Sumerlaeota bacterium]|nr:GNAT family N-acetyltransferase [Candidatus Sumerlaeota bacterium]